MGTVRLVFIVCGVAQFAAALGFAYIGNGVASAACGFASGCCATSVVTFLSKA